MKPSFYYDLILIDAVTSTRMRLKTSKASRSLSRGGPLGLRGQSSALARDPPGRPARALFVAVVPSSIVRF